LANGGSGVPNLSANTFNGNVASAGGTVNNIADGGAAFVGEGIGFTSTGNTFTSNIAGAIVGRTGQANGGALVFGSGDGTSSGDTFKSNIAVGETTAFGGAMFVNKVLAALGGTFALSGDLFQSNLSSSPQAFGGALYVGEIATISNSTFEKNRAGTGTLSGTQVGYGGAIYDDGGATITGNLIRNGSAFTEGGGLYANANEAIDKSTISGNVSNDKGGGIYMTANATVNNSTISGNQALGLNDCCAGGGGGGIYNDSGGLTLTGSTVSGNSMSTPHNLGGAGIFNEGNAELVNSTITVNNAASGPGGIENHGNARLTNVTIYKNTGGPGNVENAAFVAFTNTIVAGGDVYNEPYASIQMNDYNIFQAAIINDGAIFGTTTHDLQTDPKLLPLANNGGPTMTNADTASSPGTAYIPFSGGNCGNAAGITVDQRGYTRGAGGKCDVGAYEFAGVASGGIHLHVQPVRGTGKHRQTHPKPHLMP
jgi:hypothetical protein